MVELLGEPVDQRPTTSPTETRILAKVGLMLLEERAHFLTKIFVLFSEFEIHSASLPRLRGTTCAGLGGIDRPTSKTLRNRHPAGGNRAIHLKCHI